MWAFCILGTANQILRSLTELLRVAPRSHLREGAVLSVLDTHERFRAAKLGCYGKPESACVRVVPTCLRKTLPHTLNALQSKWAKSVTVSVPRKQRNSWIANMATHRMEGQCTDMG